MTRDDRFELYEKLYFHELDRREKISARLSLPLAATLANAGLMSFLLNSAERPQGALALSAFWLLLWLSCVSLLVGAWFFRKAWFGHTDKLLPTADQIEAYHAKLEGTYDEFENKDELVERYFSAFLFDYYKRFSSANAVNNDQRSYNIYKANAALTVAVLLSLTSAIPFYATRATSAVEQPKGAPAVNEPKAPPPPPPPPPERLVKGDVPRPPPPPPREHR